MNPCPCGYSLEKVKRCQCPSALVLSYRRKLSGPLLDRFGLFVSLSLPGSSSKEIRKELTHAFITKSIWLEDIVRKERLSFRKKGQLVKVARTIADLSQKSSISVEDLLEAWSF